MHLSGKAIVTALIVVGIVGNLSSMLFHGSFFSDSESTAEDQSDFVVALMFVVAPIIPYVLCALVLRKARNFIVVLPAVAFVLAMDIHTYIDVYHLSTSSTAAINLVVVPILNVLVLVPIGLLLGWLLSRFGPFKTRQPDI